MAGRWMQSTAARLRHRADAPARDGRLVRGQRGVALIMVLLITTLLSAVAADLKNESQVNLQAAANSRDALQSYFNARSALELELFLLRYQAMIQDSFGKLLPMPLFELSGMLVSSDTLKGIVDKDGVLPDQDGEEEAERAAPPEASEEALRALGEDFVNFNGSFFIEEVVDENRKLNLNLNGGTGFGVRSQNLLHGLIWAAIEDEKYDPLFEELGESHDPRQNRIDIIANISDWMDGDELVDPVAIVTGDNVAGSTAEDTNYDHLPYKAKYKPKDGMMNSLAELRMVPYVNDAFMRLFSDQFTVWGDRAAVSMKTASDRMLHTIINYLVPGPADIDFEAKYKQFLEYRARDMALAGGLLQINSGLFKSWMSEADLEYDSALLSQLEKKKVLRYDDEPNIYRISAVGTANDASVRITAVWRPVGNTPGEFLYWREDLDHGPEDPRRRPRQLVREGGAARV